MKIKLNEMVYHSKVKFVKKLPEADSCGNLVEVPLEKRCEQDAKALEGFMASNLPSATYDEVYRLMKKRME
jgi:hypothetical protein